MLAAEKVVPFNQSEVYDQIQLFLQKKFIRSGSERTVEAYESDIRDFFYFLTKGQRKIEFLSVEEVQLNEDDLLNYQLYLKNKRGLSNKSINRKISTIKQLYGRLYSKKLVKNPQAALLEAVSLKEKSNSHGVLSVNEALHMANLVLNQKSGKKRLTKYYLILLAIDSCLRKSSLLNLTWNDFTEYDDYVEIRATDKGNETRLIKISKEFYNELLQLKQESKTDNVFDISDQSIQSMMNYLVKEMRLENRQIVFHSFRKCGVSFQYSVSNSIMQAKKAAGHKNINHTTLYIGDSDLGVLGAISTQGNDFDNGLYKKVSYEELLKGIESLNKDQILLLNIKLNEIIAKN